MTQEASPKLQHAVVPPLSPSLKRHVVSGSRGCNHNTSNHSKPSSTSCTNPPKLEVATAAIERDHVSTHVSTVVPTSTNKWIDGNYDALPEIPMFYPIERTNTIVKCSDPSIIANRIIECMQKLSITACCNSLEVSHILLSALVHDAFISNFASIFHYSRHLFLQRHSITLSSTFVYTNTTLTTIVLY